MNSKIESDRHSRRRISREVDKYWVPIVAKTIELLDCFGSTTETLTLEEVVKRTGIPHTTAFRVLHTLVVCDYLSQSGRRYRLSGLRRRFKFGFANLSKHILLAVEIQRSLEKATAAAGIDLLVWDNDRNAETAIHNAEEMVEQKVDLAIEFQLFEQVAPVISDILSRARIPLISLVNPHHGTVYFGVNNYRAGFCAGSALAEHAIRHWRSEVGALLLLESPRAGRTVQSRLVGALRGLQERLGPLPEKAVHHLDGDGDKATSKAAVANFLKARSRKKVLIVGINDESAIGAVQAVDQAKAANDVAIVGHGGSTEIMDFISDPASSCIGTISFHAELYGNDLLHFALPLAQGRSAPAAHYVPHEFLGREALTRERGGGRLLRRSS
ncbi:MAG: substrate-binding domain-containing protein [Acidobacteriaceae bacterium]